MEQLRELEGLRRLYREVYGINQDYVKILGIRTDKKFLSSLIPEFFTETVYEGQGYWSVLVKGHRMTDLAWSELCVDIKKEFKENLMEIYSSSSNRVQFTVYLKKTV